MYVYTSFINGKDGPQEKLVHAAHSWHLIEELITSAYYNFMCTRVLATCSSIYWTRVIRVLIRVSYCIGTRTIEISYVYVVCYTRFS